MSETLKSISSLFRSLVLLMFLGFVGAAVYVGYQAVAARSILEEQLRKQTIEVEGLKADLSEKKKKLAQLELAMRLLKQNHRLAKITVLDQHESKKDPDRRETTIQFVELGDDGAELEKPRVFTVEGDVVYVEAWIVKYQDQYIEAGDPLRGTSVCLFKRLYGEYQEPHDGFPLDVKGSRPIAYERGSTMPEFEKEVWEKFWEFANDPDKAQKAGLRAAHGDAPFIQVRPGKVYTLELRASDGLTISAKDAEPAKGKNF
jgi:hypothetical protein